MTAAYGLTYCTTVNGNNSTAIMK
jgi:hypothetical protein